MRSKVWTAGELRALNAKERRELRDALGRQRADRSESVRKAAAHSIAYLDKLEAETVDARAFDMASSLYGEREAQRRFART